MEGMIKLKRVPPLFVIRATGAIRNFLISLGRGMFPPDYVMMELTTSLWLAKAIGVATDLGIADLLKEKPLHISELSALTKTHQPSLLRLMRMLSGNGIFRNAGDHIYSNTRLSEVLLEERHSMKKFIQHHMGETNWMFIGDLEKSIRSGENAIKMRTGVEPFDFLAQFPDKNEMFSQAMTDTSEMAAPLFITAYPFGKFRKIIDIGGGHGYLISAIAAKNPKTECVVLDLPQVVPSAIDNFKRFGVEGRCSFAEGDFFGNIPEDGDLYILKNILHDWEDDKSIEILKNVKKSMHEKSRLLIIDSVMDDKNHSSFGKILDLQMLIGTSGGRERTLDEFRELFSKAGLTMTRAINTATPFHFIEGKIAVK
jgi:C-methyltransferase